LPRHRPGQRQLGGVTGLCLVDQRPGSELGQIGSQRFLIQAAGQRDDEIGLLARGDLQMPQRDVSGDPDVAVGYPGTAPQAAAWVAAWSGICGSR
jgi:hypothetical protein